MYTTGRRYIHTHIHIHINIHIIFIYILLHSICCPSIFQKHHSIIDGFPYNIMFSVPRPINQSQPINQSLDLYNGDVNSKSDNDDDSEAPDVVIVNKRRVETCHFLVRNIDACETIIRIVGVDWRWLAVDCVYITPPTINLRWSETMMAFTIICFTRNSNYRIHCCSYSNKK